jgi:hypothetical protein
MTVSGLVAGIDIDAGCGQLKAELIRKRRPAAACSPSSISAAADSAFTASSSGSSSATSASALEGTASPAEAPHKLPGSGEILQESIQ